MTRFKKTLRVIFSLVFFIVTAVPSDNLGSAQPAPAIAGEEPALCKTGALPSDIQSRLKREFGSWKIQDPADLSPSALERWESEKPLECPGIAVGKFESAKTPSCTVLLVPVDPAPNAGYRFIVLNRIASQQSYEIKVVEQSDDTGASNFFIHKVRISNLFDEASKRKFQVQTSEGILLVDAGDKEYEADIYFWTDASYQHEPVDY